MQEFRIVGKDIRQTHIEIIKSKVFNDKKNKGSLPDGTIWELKDVPE